MSQPHIHTISFSEQGIEILYAEQADIDKADETGILRSRSVICPIRLVQDEVTELMDDATQLLDKILLLERSPASSFRR